MCPMSTKRSQARREKSMKILRSSARKTNIAPASNFTGTVFSDEVVVGSVAVSNARFCRIVYARGPDCLAQPPRRPDAILSSGAGRVQREGEQVQEIRAGDTVHHPTRRAPLAWRCAGQAVFSSGDVGAERQRRGDGLVRACRRMPTTQAPPAPLAECRATDRWAGAQSCTPAASVSAC